MKLVIVRGLGGVVRSDCDWRAWVLDGDVVLTNQPTFHKFDNVQLSQRRLVQKLRLVVQIWFLMSVR
jgi:hypothetical protein